MKLRYFGVVSHKNLDSPGSSPGQAYQKSLPWTRSRARNPELIEITGFPLQFTPDSIRGGNDEKRKIRTFYETINLESGTLNFEPGILNLHARGEPGRPRNWPESLPCPDGYPSSATASFIRRPMGTSLGQRRSAAQKSASASIRCSIGAREENRRRALAGSP